MLPHRRDPNGKGLDMRLVAGKEVDRIKLIYLRPTNRKATSEFEEAWGKDWARWKRGPRRLQHESPKSPGWDAKEEDIRLYMKYEAGEVVDGIRPIMMKASVVSAGGSEGKGFGDETRGWPGCGRNPTDKAGVEG